MKPLSDFQQMVRDDIKGTFLNLEEFGETRTVEYDGNTYEDLQCVIRDVREDNRSQYQSDHVQGLYRTSTVLHCSYDDIGLQPEKGMRIYVQDRDSTYMRCYLITVSYVELGMLHLVLEAIDE